MTFLWGRDLKILTRRGGFDTGAGIAKLANGAGLKISSDQGTIRHPVTQVYEGSKMGPFRP